MNDLRSFESPVAEADGLDRRSFVKAVTMAAAAVGLNATAAAKMVEGGRRGPQALGHLAPLPGVHRVHGVAPAHVAPGPRHAHPRPRLARLHETLMAAAGVQAEDALKAAMEKNAGKYICVIEGAIPTKDDGSTAWSAAARRSTS